MCVCVCVRRRAMNTQGHRAAWSFGGKTYHARVVVPGLYRVHDLNYNPERLLFPKPPQKVRHDEVQTLGTSINQSINQSCAQRGDSHRAKVMGRSGVWAASMQWRQGRVRLKGEKATR